MHQIFQSSSALQTAMRRLGRVCEPLTQYTVGVISQLQNRGIRGGEIATETPNQEF